MNALESITENCTECRLCVQECFFLSKLDKTPKSIASELNKTDLDKSYVMECFLCGLCRAVCPFNLDFPSVIRHARQALSANAAANICYRLSLPDDPLFFSKAYKRHKNLNYESLEKKSFKYVFFPGCAMTCYSPEATVKAYEKLREKLDDVGIVDSCCGKPLSDMGLSERASKWLLELETRLKEHGCTVIITACPMCYYYMQSAFQNKFEILTIYEVLEDVIKEGLADFNFKVAIHDSCPDRFKSVFATQVRGFFKKNQIVEMPHSKEKSICCGAGGSVSCADPNLAAMASKTIAREFLETGADLMVVYCYTCAQVFWASQPNSKTKHILDLALKTRDASEDVKSQEINKFVMQLLMDEI